MSGGAAQPMKGPGDLSSRDRAKLRADDGAAQPMGRLARGTASPNTVPKPPVIGQGTATPG